MSYRIVTDTCCDFPQEMYAQLNLTVVPIYINIDTENNFPVLEQPVNQDNPAKIIRQNNGVHPIRPGYYQMGDTLYCYLKALLHSK